MDGVDDLKVEGIIKIVRDALVDIQDAIDFT